MKPEKISDVIKSVLDKSMPIEGMPIELVRFNRDMQIGIICCGPFTEGGQKACATVAISDVSEVACDPIKFIEDRTSRAIDCLRALVAKGEPVAA